jgi:hypothetical protein
MKTLRLLIIAASAAAALAVGLGAQAGGPLRPAAAAGPVGS